MQTKNRYGIHQVSGPKGPRSQDMLSKANCIWIRSSANCQSTPLRAAYFSETGGTFGGERSRLDSAEQGEMAR